MHNPIKEVNLTIDNKPRQTFRSYGIYLSGCGQELREIKSETKDKIAKIIFEDLKMNLLHAIVHIPKDDSINVDDTEELDNWIQKKIILELGIGDGSPIDYMRRYGAELAVCFCDIKERWLHEVLAKNDLLGANDQNIVAITGQSDMSWLPGEKLRPLKEDSVDEYVHSVFCVLKRLLERWNLPIKYVATYDEPNFGRIMPETMCHIHKKLRKKLDDAGYTDITINGAEVAGINFAFTEIMSNYDKEAYDLLGAVTLHGFGTGFMDTEHAQKAEQCGKEVWITSSGSDPRIKYSDLPRDAMGRRYFDTVISAVKNMSAIIVDLNLYVSYMAMWLGLMPAKADKSALNEVWYHLLAINPDESTLGTDLLASPEYYFMKNFVAAIEPKCVMRYCESGDEGDMSERYNLLNDMKNQMAACAGVNGDGTYGIIILNKTDSDTRKKQMAAMKDCTKSSTLVQHSVCLRVKVEAKDLKDSGVKYFKVSRIGKSGKQDGEIISAIDGKFTIDVNPFEMLTLREEK